MDRGRTREPSQDSLRSLSKDSICSLSSSSSFELSHDLSPERNSCANIVIKGLSRNVIPDHLREIFSSYGTVKHVELDAREMSFKRIN